MSVKSVGKLSAVDAHEKKVEDLTPPVPQEIQVTDPHYHPRDVRLIWDPAVVLRKLRTEQEYAASQVDTSDYVHPSKLDKTACLDKPDFYHLCISQGGRDQEIEQEAIELSNGRKVGIAYSQGSFLSVLNWIGMNVKIISEQMISNCLQILIINSNYLINLILKA